MTDPARLALITFTGAVLVQGFHEVEHVLQVVEKHSWHWTVTPGLLGQWFDLEWVHVLFNGALWLALLATWLIRRKNPGIWDAPDLAAAALTFAMLFQGYHWAEHLVRMAQYLQGVYKPLGVVGQIFPGVELHFWINGVVFNAMLFSYVLFRPWSAIRSHGREALPSLG